jgi:hypothetical protein
MHRQVGEFIHRQCFMRLVIPIRAVKSIASYATHVTRHLMIHLAGLLELSVQKLPNRAEKQTGQTCFAYKQWRCILYTQRVGEGKPTNLQSKLSYGGRFWKV